MRYSAFISYNHRDKEVAIWLHRALERFRFPKRLVGQQTSAGAVPGRLKPVFRDRDELAAAANLSAAVRGALEQAENLIVLCSPNGARSQWVNEEIRTFRALGKGDRIRCVIIAGEPHAADPAQEALPPALFEDGNVEPLAADIRPEQDGKRGALLKLIASLVELPYDELRQREAARRQRRLAVVAAASSLGLIITSGLAVFAFISRAAAVEQREIAERRTVTAERTVDFVKSLFEASDPSDARGEAVSAGEILDRGVREISTGLVAEPEVRAELGITLAQVYATLGAYRKGEALARWSFGIRHQDPETHARQWLVLADLQQQAGDYQGAIKTFRAGITAARAAGPDAVGSLGALHAGLGSALSQEGEPGAQAELQEALRIDSARFGPDHNSVARDLEAIGLDAIASKDYAAARASITRALAIRQQREGAMSPSVSDNLNSLGSIAYQEGDLASAQRYFASRLTIDEKVLGRDHPDIGVTLNNIARILIERRDYARAEPLLDRAVRLALRERDETHDDFAFTFANLGIAQIGTGKTDAGKLNMTRALRAAQIHRTSNLAMILADLADVECQSGQSAQGLARIAQARAIMQQAEDEAPWRRAWADSVNGYCRVRAGNAATGAELIRAAQPIIAARFPATAHYRALTDRHARAIGR